MTISRGARSRRSRPLLPILLLPLTGCAGSLSPASLPMFEPLGALEAKAESTLVRLGAAYRESGALQKARSVLERVTQENPESEGGSMFLALTMEDLGLFPEAQGYYQRYLEVGADAILQEELDARIMDLRGRVEDRIPLLQRREMRAAIDALIDGRAAVGPPDERLVALFPFIYRGEDDATFGPLARALTALLEEDLRQVEGLEVVRGVEVGILLDEISATVEGEAADPATIAADPLAAMRGGRILGAARVVQGILEGDSESIQVLASMVDARGALPEELRPLTAGGGLTERLFEVEKELARSVLESVGIEVTPEIESGLGRFEPVAPEALVAYGQGLQAEDRGDFATSAAHFVRAVGIDPSFELAKLREEVVSALARALQQTTEELGQLAAAALLGGPPTPLAEGEGPGVEDVAGALGRVAGWQLDGFVGLLNDEPEFNPDEEGPDADQFRRDAIVGLRTGYAFADGALFAVLEAANSLVMFDSPSRPVDREADSFWFGASGGYNLPPWGRVQVFPAVGLGIVVWDVQGVEETETNFTLNYGVGAKYLFNRRLGVRWDARMHQVPGALLDTRRRLGEVGDEGADLFGLEMSVGVTFRPGR